MDNDEIRPTLVRRRREILTRYRNELERANERWDERALAVTSRGDLREVAQLTAAIRRIDDGTYGICVECGAAIDLERLWAMATTSRCADCAEALDAIRQVMP